MLRIILLIILFISILSSNTIPIQKLQEQFLKDVIEVNAFRKRFAKYLEKNCDNDFNCVKEKIEQLKMWDTVKNDNFLKYILNKKIKRLKFDDLYWNQLLLKLKDKNLALNSTQFVSIIDLEKQYYILTIWDNINKNFNYIGMDLISSGNIKREAEIKFGENHYLKTPSGIFESKLGWRSDGKIGEDNVTLGYGAKDRFVFYFGKHNTIRYNTFDKNRTKIYDPNKWKLITDKLDLAVHSHESSRPMGQPNSHGCVRMSDELNRFLDNNLILHKNVLNGSQWIHKYSKEPESPNYYDFAGKYLIIFDDIH